MLSFYTAFSLLIGYGILLYLLASWGESNSGLAKKARGSSVIYSLSLAVYCTSWTFYGSVGQASQTGMQYIALYLGSSLAFILITPLFKRMVKIKQYYHSTSIVDFISTRYNHSQVLAALLSLLCLLGITPYISIQLKSITTTFALLVENAGTENSYFLYHFDFVVVCMMILFTIAFGVRHLDPTERHPGMMIALAIESLFKLIAFLVAGIFVCFFIFDSPFDIVSLVDQQLSQPKFTVFETPPSISGWFASMFLGIIGVIALPRQFHVGIVECQSERHLDSAKWQFPLYLLLINIFVTPLAMAGTLHLPESYNVDFTVILLPILEGNAVVTMLVFLGGFAASTCMVMVSSMTLSTMTTNHLVVPIIEAIAPLRFLRRYLLYVRWCAVALILFFGMYYHRAVSESEYIVQIGSISFVAIAQLLPALIGGMTWIKGNKQGAIVGVCIGMIIWLYTLLLPSFIQSGWIISPMLSAGLFGQNWLKPEALFGLSFSSNIAHSLFWSLLFNIVSYVLISEYYFRKQLGFNQIAREFLSIGTKRALTKESKVADAKDILLADKKAMLLVLLSKYLSTSEAEKKVGQSLSKLGLQDETYINIVELTSLRAKLTNALAGIIGMAAANKAMNAISLFTGGEQQRLTHYYSTLLASTTLSPEALLQKVDFYQERQAILESHAQLQEKTIAALQLEKEAALTAKQALDSMNTELEKRVEERTRELTNTNLELTKAMETLKSTQLKLIEAEKMASLGQLVAGVAHEINTPIGVIVTAISTLQGKLKSIEEQYEQGQLSKQELAQFIAQAEMICELTMSNVNRASDLITDFKRAAVGQDGEQKSLFFIKPNFERVLLTFQSKLKEMKVVISLDCDDQIELFSYPKSLSQVLNQLITNSLTHGFKNQSSGNVYVNVLCVQDSLIIKYSDDGQGVSEQEIGKIFEPFYTTNRNAGGKGLGAHILYNLVTQVLKGQIEVNSPVGQGLAYTICIPLTKCVDHDASWESP